ncbi:MAG TPA: hypothetical protein VNQ90_02365 [Chthoniobacteraceae bacterium]|nr:hypothetical protein [Chthoniobacteraceae bacterium]
MPTSPPAPLKRVAVLSTAFFPLSHTDVILSRWRTPLPGDAAWGWQPGGQCVLASLYVDQCDPESPGGKEALGEAFAAREGLRFASGIEEALTLGTGRLAVDGVLLIAEHGSYPLNGLGQLLYPRKAWFDRVVAVFRQSGRSVPVFCDKHLSYEIPGAVEMVRTAREMGFALFAGSALPWGELEPPLEWKREEPLAAALCIFYGGPEVYGFHGLELLASVVEQRRGGESGVSALTAWRGRAVREVLPTLPAGLRKKALEPILLNADVRETLAGDSDRLVLVAVEHRDGLRSWLLGLDRAHRRFTMALQQGRGEPVMATLRCGNAEDGYGHFARLNGLLEKMFLSGQPPIPPERTLFTTSLLVHIMEALARTGCRLEIPVSSPAYAPHRTP